MKTRFYAFFKASPKNAPLDPHFGAEARILTLQGQCKAILRALKPELLAAINEAASETLVASVSACNDAAPSVDKEWVRISPYGEFPNEVGLQIFDREAASRMVSAFNSVSGRVQRFFRGTPYYVGHPDDPRWAAKNPNVPARAVARIKELEARDDGLWGLVAFNDEGKTLVGGDAAPYAFHSPRWGMQQITHKGGKAFRPVELYSVGLTNNPNIPGNAIGINEPLDADSPTMKKDIIKLLAALGKTVADAATDEQLAAAINEAVPVAQASVTNAAALQGVSMKLENTQTQLTAAQNEATLLRTEVATVKTTASNERAARTTAVLAVAINTGRITEAQRAEWQGKFANAADFAAVETDLNKLKPAVNTSSLVDGLGQRKPEMTVNAARVTAINEAVAKHCKENGLDPAKDHHRAFLAVKAAQPALFTNATA